MLARRRRAGRPPPSPNWRQSLDLDKNNFLTVVGDVLKFSGKIGRAGEKAGMSLGALSRRDGEYLLKYSRALSFLSVGSELMHLTLPNTGRSGSQGRS